jgi:pyruvate dehydrogenase E2 component (dihydrolipoamide acetyltransferase)
MMIPIQMPKYGQQQDEGTVVRWLKQVGQAVQKGEALVEVETDKASFEHEAPETGFLRRIIAEESAVVPVNSIIAVMTEQADEEYEFDAPGAGDSVPSADSAQRAPASIQSVPAGKARIRSSPAAKKRARELGVDLAAVTGTGPGGRITVENVEGTTSGETSPVPEKAAAGLLPLSRMRQAIGRQMSSSKQTIPHFYVAIEIDMTEAESWRKSIGKELSATDLIVKAAAMALMEHPRLNARLEGDDAMVEHDHVNIGLAVGLEDGLLVPVLEHAEMKSLPALASDRQRVVESARNGRLVASGKATCTISNLGMFGVTSFTAIVNPPECASLAVGAILQRVCPIGEGGDTAVRRILEVTLSADHRLADGMLAARFLQDFKEKLENVETIQGWMNS